MGIFSRFTDIINANLNAILDKAEDPEKMVQLIIQEMEETLVEVRTQSAKLIADKKEVGRRSKRLTREAEEWERKAEIALNKAAEAPGGGELESKSAADETVITIESDLESVEMNLDQISADIGQLQRKLVDAKSRQKALILRGRTAKSRMGVKRQLHDVDSDEAMSKFDRYDRRIDDLEGEIEAYDLGQKNLADEIAELESDEKVDEELAKLKARLGQDATASDDTADTKSEES